MPKIKNPIRRLLDRLQNRFARSRPGSVLVLVVALLVLMALIGTAYITTARTDRFSAQQNALNTQIDLLLQGVINMAEADMTTSAHQQAGGQHWDDTRTDTWLSSRIPIYFPEACGVYVPGNTYAKGDIVIAPYDPNPVNYASSTVYLSLMDGNATSGSAPAPTVGVAWKSLGPYSSLPSYRVWQSVSSPLAPNAMYEDPRFPLNPFPGHNSSQPGIIAAPTSLTLGGKSYPAFQLYDPASGTWLQQPVLAASASGDGIADALLWRLPIGEMNGVTYYAATRIVDNSAAINLNTALSNTWDFDSTGNALTSLKTYQLSPGIFPGNIGLAEMLRTFNLGNSYTTIGSEMVNLNKYRCGIPRGDVLTLADGLAPGTSPIDVGTRRTDFQYTTVSEAMFMGLGRRLNNPGLFSNTPPLGVQFAPHYQALSWGDAAALAFKFELVNSNSSTSNAEDCLLQSLYSNPSTNTNYRSIPYNPADVVNWFTTFQDRPYGQPYAPINTTTPQFCLRPFVTTHDPLNNLMPAQNLNGAPTLMGSYNPSTNTTPRISLNTAGIFSTDTLPANPPRSLWLGFYNAMYAGATLDPLNPGQPFFKQFRSSLRDLKGTDSTATTYFTPLQQLWVRSLIAAVNAQDLRDSDDDVTSRTISFLANVNNGALNNGKNGGGSTPVNVTVFGTERQLYITEVYANNDNAVQPDFVPNVNGDPSQVQNKNHGKVNKKGYVAIEVHNPYPFSISLSGYQLGILNRSATAVKNAYPAMAMAPIAEFIKTGFGPPSVANTIPPYGYAILENYQEAATNDDAQYRPQINYPGYTAPANSIYFYVKNLHQVFSDPAAPPDTPQPGGELFLLKARNANGFQPFELDANGLPLLANLVPVDSFDFSGTLEIQPMGSAAVFKDMHYVRANGIYTPPQGGSTINNHWRFVYPGRWNNTAGTRQEGVFFSTSTRLQWDATSNTGPNSFDPWIISPPGGATPAGPGPTPASDGSSLAGAAPINLGNPDPAPSYMNKFPPIQLNNMNFGGSNKLNSGMPFKFPYGGFARLGDVLQVPFIGGYTVTDQQGHIIEMNAVTMDSSFADDQDGGGSPSGPDDPVEQIGRFCPLTATDLSHKFFNPNNVQVIIAPLPPPPAPPPPGPVIVDGYGWAANVMDYFTVIENPHDDYLPNVDPIAYSQIAPAPTPVPNLPKLIAFTANQGNEDLVPIEGLININTAPFAVLRRVPFILDPMKNDQIALSIVTYRNSNGPYKTLFDLNKVPGFQSAYGDPSLNTTTSSYDTGDLSTFGPQSTQSDGVINDFEKRFMAMTRVSNLLTTRSDTYTAYILVQGWRGVGTANPELVVQRRAAFIADRSGVTASNKSLNVINVQAN